MGLKLGVFGFCRPHTQKQTQNKCVHDLHAHAALCPCLSSCLDHRQVTCTPDEPQLFWLQGKPKETPNLSPMPGSKWRRFWDLHCISVIQSKMCFKLCITQFSMLVTQFDQKSCECKPTKLHKCNRDFESSTLQYTEIGDMLNNQDVEMITLQTLLFLHHGSLLQYWSDYVPYSF